MKERLNRSFFVFVVLHIREFIFYYIGAMLCLVGLNYFQSQIPLMTKQMGDMTGANDYTSLSLWYLVVIGVSILIFRTLSRLLFFYPARVQQKYLRNELLWKLSETPPLKYETYNSGQIYQTLFNDLNSIRGFMGFALLQLGNMIIALVIFIPKIQEVDANLLYAYLPFVIGMVIFSLSIVSFAPFEKKGVDFQGDVQQFLVESYQGRSTIKNFNVEESFITRFSSLSLKELKMFYKASLGRVISVPIIRLSLGASFLWGAYIVRSEELGASTLIFFSSFLFLLFEPFMFLSWIGVISTSAWASWKRIKKLHALTQINLVEEKQSLSGKLEVQVSLWNKEGHYEFLPNQHYVITGETGSGKTHFIGELANLLFHRKLSYSLVFQEPYLYNDTLIRNIFLGKEITEDDKKRAHELLRVFYLDEILELKNFWELELGENGKRLSGGQAKRLVLIRSLMSDASVLLWDDPFSSVDVLQERSIWNHLCYQNYFENKLLIFSAHRYSSVKLADELILIRKDGLDPLRGKTKEVLLPDHEQYEYFKKQLI